MLLPEVDAGGGEPQGAFSRLDDALRREVRELRAEARLAEGGEAGGELLYEGPPGPFLRSRPGFFRLAPTKRVGSSPRPAPGLRIRGARAHNLRIEDLQIPLRGIVAISGVSAPPVPVAAGAGTIPTS